LDDKLIIQHFHHIHIHTMTCTMYSLNFSTLKNRFNYAFSPHFYSKILIWSLYFSLSQFGPCFGKFDLKLVISVSGTVQR